MKENQINDSEEMTQQFNFDSKKKEEYNLQEIQSERVTEDIEDDLTSLRKNLYQTPLSFYVKVGSSYLISFRKAQLLAHLGKTFVLAILQISVSLFMLYVLSLPQSFKSFIIALVSINLSLFVLLFFVDPGTLLEDEDEQIDNERYFCRTCRIYRYDGTHHCVFCVKCVKGYDHHCSFFGKCIGRRNYLMFVFFLVSMAAGGMSSMGGLIYTLAFTQ